MKKILILGAGLVVKPMVEYLLEHKLRVTIATTTKEKADRMINGDPLGYAVRWSTEEVPALEKMVSENDVVVSFLPYKYHVFVAKNCLKYKKPLVTTSYVSAEMQSLDSDARGAGILLLNEIGLDPGIDHMTAMKIIDHIHCLGGKVKEFYSLCGALPAPQNADNPLRYKFSWSPKGVIQASRNGAKYLKKGRIIEIEPIDLFSDRFTYNFPGLGLLEVYPNRDSISYTDIYGISEAETMYRGTFRYKGWCETLDAMKHLNMLDDTRADFSGMDYSAFLSSVAGVEKSDLKKGIALKLGINEDSNAVSSLEWLGFFSDEKLNYSITSPFEITSDIMIRKMSLRPDDHDTVMMQHVFLAEYPDGKSEVIKSSMIDFGSPSGNTAVARTVALPASIAVKMILDGKLNITGVHRPVVPQIYEPVIKELKGLDIEMKEEFGLPESEMIK
jgi:saccharopine dehydrogenase-like NADP-dependent oxidoreductase